ncbi:hypothetical protein F4809DRAFT_609976 [Biscogniauxia mediterranea]|nr:hypothetical protein F4809DRAFT_609976 [Biscogniauxia mediterranea]
MQNAVQSERLDRLERLILGPRDEGEVTPERAVGRLISKPANLRENLPRLSSAHKKPLPNKFMSLICTCCPRRSMKRTSFLGSWLDIHNGNTWKEHLPGCPLSPARTTCQRRLCIRSAGLARLLGSAIEATFTLSSGAGGFSMGPYVTYYPTINSRTAPAFRIMKLLREATYYTDRRGFTTHLWVPFLLSSIARIAKLFHEGRASPLAVTESNQNLNHYIGPVAREVYFLLFPDIQSHVLEVLRTLIKLGVPINSHDCRGNSPLYYMTISGSDWTLNAAEIIFQSTAETVLASTQECVMTPKDDAWRLIHTLSESTTLAESYGCGPLSPAVIENDKDQVEYLLAHQPATLNERNILGQSPLHLAADKPVFLALLVRASDSAKISSMDGSGYTVLKTAMMLSSANCLNGSQNIKCSGCGCADSV